MKEAKGRRTASSFNRSAVSARMVRKAEGCAYSNCREAPLIENQQCCAALMMDGRLSVRRALPLKLHCGGARYPLTLDAAAVLSLDCRCLSW